MFELDIKEIEDALRAHRFRQVMCLEPEEFLTDTPGTLYVCRDNQGRRKLIAKKYGPFTLILERTLSLDKRKLTESYSEERFKPFGFIEIFHYFNELDPGAEAGKHAHGKKWEKFRAVSSEKENLMLDLLDTDSGQEKKILMNSRKIEIDGELFWATYMIMPGIWHAVSNPATNQNTIALFVETNTVHDPEDDIPFKK